MSNDPNNIDPKPTPSPLPPASEGNKDDQIYDLSDLDNLPTAEAEEPLAEAEPLDEPSPTLQPPSENVIFDVVIPSDDPASMTVGIPLSDIHNLADIPQAGLSENDIPSAGPSSDYVPMSLEPGSDFDLVTTPDPASSVSLGSEVPPGSSQEIPKSSESAAIGNLEPVAPVVPASGWLDGDSDDLIDPKAAQAKQFPEPLEVHQADLLDAPPAIESSDIFSSGPIPTASAAGGDQSDVIAATAFTPTTATPSDKPDRPSEIALSFDQPPGGSTVQHEGGSGDLPVAEELTDGVENLLDSNRNLTDTPLLPDSQLLREETADYGSTPIASPDASSILSDLSDPGEITFDESSSVRLEAPGVGRTLSNNPGSGTEFDLTISDDQRIPELEAAAADSDRGESTNWQEQSGSDLFSDARTSVEINLGSDSERVVPIDSDLLSEDPSLTSSTSSIFSGEKIPGAPGSKSGPGSDNVRIGRPEEEDAAVEFSDHPTADPEAANAALAGPPSPVQNLRQTVEKIDLETPKKTTPSSAAPISEPPDSERVDWGKPGITDDSEEDAIGFPHALLNAPPSGILEHGEQVQEPENEPTRAEIPKAGSNHGRASRVGGGKVPDGSDPSIEIDWMAGSSSEQPIVRPSDYEQAVKEREKEKEKDKSKSKDRKRQNLAREPEGAREKKGGGGAAWVGGTLLGMIVAGGACAGLYFGGVIPNAEPTTKAPESGNRQGPNIPPAETHAPLSVADARSALDAGDPARALKVLDTLKSADPEKVSAETKAAIGQARLFAKVQSLGDAVVAAGNDPELNKAREELQAVVADVDAVKTPEGEKAAVKAAIHLGLTYELAGDRAKAKEVYEDAATKFPKYKTTFQAALDRLAATAPATDSTSIRLTPADAQQLLFAVLLLTADPPAKEEEEAGALFWKAVNLATAGKYGDAVDEIKKAKAVHVKQAKAMVGRGLNPLSDPLEQIFPRCCDDLKAYWELRSAIYANKSVADLLKKEGAEKAMSELAAAQKKAVEAVKLMTDLKEATGKLTKAEQDLKDAQDKYAAAEKQYLANEAKAKEDLTKTKEDLTKTKEDLTKTKEDFTKTKADLTKSKEELVKAKETYLDAEASRKKAEDVITSLAKELQAAKILPEKFNVAELLAAQKSAVQRATGPTLTTLVSPGVMAIGGGGLSAGQLVDIAERMSKAEAAAKIASDKLATETKRLMNEREAEIKKLKDSHATDVKKLTDEYATEMKKLMDANATNTTKLKEEQVAELKKMADKYTVDLKKLMDDNATAVKKVTEGYENKIKSLEAAVAKEKTANEALTARLKTDVGSAMTPTLALDLWLPQLTELRRVADADPAIVNARKVLAIAPPDSEDAAKARTVAGIALLLKGNLVEAKELLQAARSSPAYKDAAAAGKEWARATDIGLESISDPLAPYRLPVEKPKRDLKAAARSLDRGISAYKTGRYAEAVNALIDSTKADPTDPIAWYYLGAARWATGAIDQAKADYRQGGEWEKLSSLLARTISDNLEPIQGPARDALTIARP